MVIKGEFLRAGGRSDRGEKGPWKTNRVEGARGTENVFLAVL